MPDGSWERGLGPARGPRAVRGRGHRAARDGHDDRGRLRAVRPPRDRLPRVARPPHAHHAQRPRGRRGGARQADLLLPRPPRPLARADRRRLGRARRRGDRRVDRRPGVLVGRARDGNRPARPHRRLRRRHGARRAQVRRPLRGADGRDGPRRLRQRLDRHGDRGRRRRSATGCGASGWTRATRSSTARCGRRWATSGRPASTSASCARSAPRSTTPVTGACGSSCPAASRSTASATFEAEGVPVDAYGVGSSLIRGANDFTADVVQVNGRPVSKVGRSLRPNPRLEVVS